MDFDGRIALITGGASGIGLASARRIQAGGGRVAVLDLEPASVRAVSDELGGALGIACDVTRSAEVDAAVARVEEELGGLDVLVCSAGISGASLRTVDVDDAEWGSVMAVNANGVFYANRAALPGMVARGYGRIVNLASVAGKEGNPMAAAYSAAKAAVIGMTKAIGKDVATTGVLVNCVTPSPVETPMLVGHLAGAHRLHARARADGTPRARGGGGGADRVSRERPHDVLDGRRLRPFGRQADVLMGAFSPRGWRLVRLGGEPEPRLGRNRPGRAGRRARAARARPAGRAPPRPRALRRPRPSPSTWPRIRRRSHRCRCSPRSRPAEIWAAGVTYERSRHARVEESASSADVYALVYDAERPELFLKDAGCRRTVGPNEAVAVRTESRWTVPEPELGLVLDEDGSIIAVTAGNDLTARDIEAENPLYLPQAKMFAACCALGPAVLVPDDPSAPYAISVRIWNAEGALVNEDATSTAAMHRSFEELASWCFRENPVPAGSVLLTGTGVVPPDDVALAPGYRVEVEVEGIGVLSNPVRAA